MRTGEEPGTDGRSLRRTRNREAVLDAVIAIFESGDVDPSIDAIAARAGVSNRSIYRYFDHRDHVVRAAITNTMRRVLAELTLDQVGVGSYDERAERFVDHRITIHQRLAPIARAAKIASVSQPVIAEEFEVGRVILRQTLVDQFAPELRTLSAGDQTRTVIAAGLAFFVEALDYLWIETNGDLVEIRSLLLDHLRTTVGSTSS
jgi:AcrR family transcriptional regulator